MVLIFKEMMWVARGKWVFWLKTKFSSFFALMQYFVITLVLLFGAVFFHRSVEIFDSLDSNWHRCPYVPVLKRKKCLNDKWLWSFIPIAGHGREVSSNKSRDVSLFLCAHKRTELISTSHMCKQEPGARTAWPGPWTSSATIHMLYPKRLWTPKSK